MSNPKDAADITLELAGDVEELVKAWKRGDLGGGPPGKNRRAQGPRPPLRGILLEDLQDGGDADCAVTVYSSTSFIQQVEILGTGAAGTFTLQFKGQTTTALQWNAAAADVEKALAALSTIGANNVKVALGGGQYTNIDNPDGSPQTDTPGVWLVSFVGMFAASTVAPPLLVPISSLTTGPSVMISETTHWADTGKVETVNAIIPVGVPTPMQAGAVVAAIHFPGLGYGVISCEPRYYQSTY